MTFQIQNFARASASANEGIEVIQQMNTTASPAYMYNADVKGCFRKYSYYSSTFTGTSDDPSLLPNSGDSHSLIGGNNPDGTGYFDLVAGDLQVNDIIEAYSVVDNFRVNYRVAAINSTSPKVVVTPTNNNGMIKLVTSLTPIFAADGKTITSYTLLASPIVVIPAMVNAIVAVNSVVFATKIGGANGGTYGAGESVGLAYGATGAGAVITAANADVATGLTTGASIFIPVAIAATGALTALTVTQTNSPVVLTSVANVAFTATNPNTVSPLTVYVNYSVFARV